MFCVFLFGVVDGGPGVDGLWCVVLFVSLRGWGGDDIWQKNCQKVPVCKGPRLAALKKSLQVKSLGAEIKGLCAQKCKGP